MTGSVGSRTLSQWPILAIAGALFLLLPPVSPARAALGQQAPPDDAPLDEPAAEGLAPRQGPVPATPREPLPEMPPNIGGGVWLAEGPGPAIDGQVEAIVPGPNEVVGAVHTVAAHPVIPDVLYAGAVNGGIWKTDNATATHPIWIPQTDFETSLSIGALEFDPTDPTAQTLVAGVGRYSSFGSRGGVRTGQLLKTVDGGATWTTLPGFMGTTGMNYSPAGISGVAPRGSTIVASANISDRFFCSDIGIWRSTDGGANFGKVSVAAGIPDGIASDLAGDPAGGSTLFTGITYGIYCTGSLPNGIYRSTDTGASWTKVSTPAMDALILDGTTNNIEIAVDGMDVYVNIVQNGRTVGIFHSANGGTTWTAMDLPRTPEGTPMVIVSPDVLTPGAPIVIDHTASGTPHGLNSGMEVEVTGVAGTTGANGIWTISRLSSFSFSLNGSSDATPWVSNSGSWTKVVGLNPKVKPGSQGWVHASIRVDPVVGSIVYLGGDRQDYPFPNYLGAWDYSGRLFRGDSSVTATGAIPSPQWQHLTHLMGVPTLGGGTLNVSSPHADSREMVFDAAENLIEGDDGGIYRRTSPSSSAGDWFSINGNLQVTEMHDVAHDAVSDVIMSGNQDTGTTQQQMAGGNLTWDSVSTADGGDVAIDDRSAPTVSTRYSSYQNLGAFRRREYDASNGLLTEVFPTLTLLGGSPAPVGKFVTPVELNTIVPTSLVLGASNAIYESFDKGDSINALPGLGVPSSTQNAIAYGGVSGGVPNPDVLWAGTGAVVQLRTAPDPAPLVATPTAFPGGTVNDIVLDPTEWATAYVVDDTNIYQTHDGGITWTNMTGNLTDTRITTLTIDPTPPARLFLGGREGVFETRSTCSGSGGNRAVRLGREGHRSAQRAGLGHGVGRERRQARRRHPGARRLDAAGERRLRQAGQAGGAQSVGLWRTARRSLYPDHRRSGARGQRRRRPDLQVADGPARVGFRGESGRYLQGRQLGAVVGHSRRGDERLAGGVELRVAGWGSVATRWQERSRSDSVSRSWLWPAPRPSRRGCRARRRRSSRRRDSEAFELAPGVVADPSSSSIYVARTGGGIEALDLGSGKVRWSREDAARPLLARGGLLVAQRESGAGLPLAILDATDGALRQRLELPLPEGVRAAVDESLEVRFTISARGAGERVLIEWDYLERDVLGVSPPEGRPFARHEVGAVGLELSGGEARVLAGADLPSVVDDTLPPAVERLVAAGELRAPPWRTGDLLAARAADPRSRRAAAGAGPLAGGHRRGAAGGDPARGPAGGRAGRRRPPAPAGGQPSRGDCRWAGTVSVDDPLAGDRRGGDEPAGRPLGDAVLPAGRHAAVPRAAFRAAGRGRLGGDAACGCSPWIASPGPSCGSARFATRRSAARRRPGPSPTFSPALAASRRRCLKLRDSASRGRLTKVGLAA